MDTVTTVRDIKDKVAGLKAQGFSIGLVPTMGGLHKGHLSLIRRARQENDTVVLSIFVNPTQFDRRKDLEDYPRDLEDDKELAQKGGVDIVFAPGVEEMYPGGFSTYVEVEGLTKGLCGAFRPGHFRGVTTVVTKLFNIIRPDRAYLGEKDFQQTVVVKRLVKDLNMDVEVVALPTVRDMDGLALSSRNVRLGREDRVVALSLYKALLRARKLFASGVTDSVKIIQQMRDTLHKAGIFQIDYISIVDPETLEELEEANPRAMATIAAWVKDTRLIDNMCLSETVDFKAQAPSLDSLRRTVRLR